MAAYTIKTNGACAGGGHFTVNVTGGTTASLNAVTVQEYTQIKDRVEAMTNRDRLLAVLALHQLLGALTNGQVLAELQSVNGVQVTL